MENNKKMFVPPLDLKTIENIEKKLRRELQNETDNDTIDSYLKGVRNGITTYQEYLLDELDVFNRKRRIKNVKKHPIYWKISYKGNVIKDHFSSEKAAIKKAEELAGENWETFVDFYEYNWVNKKKGYYEEYAYSF